jgi:hypothetical protein
LQLGVLEVSARFPNTSPRAVVAPTGTRPEGPGRTPAHPPEDRVRQGRVGLCAPRWALSLLAVAVLAGGLGACGGGGSPSAQSLLDETFKSHKTIDSGRIELSFSLSPVGPGGRFSVRLSGPFQSLGAGRLPRFALQLGLTTAGNTLQAGVTSTGGRLFVELEGVPFLAPESTVQALQQGYADASRGPSLADGRSTFAALGIAPGEWLTHPALAGSGKAAGVDTVHIVAGLDMARFLADAEKLSRAGGSLGLPSADQGAGLSRAQISALANSVRSARVDVYIGKHDHLLRDLSLRAAISTSARARATLAGLSSATLSLVLRLGELNHPQRIAPPSNPQPVSRLLAVLERLGLPKHRGARG